MLTKKAFLSKVWENNWGHFKEVTYSFKLHFVQSKPMIFDLKIKIV